MNKSPDKTRRPPPTAEEVAERQAEMRARLDAMETGPDFLETVTLLQAMGDSMDQKAKVGLH